MRATLPALTYRLFVCQTRRHSVGNRVEREVGDRSIEFYSVEASITPRSSITSISEPHAPHYLHTFFGHAQPFSFLPPLPKAARDQVSSEHITYHTTLSPRNAPERNAPICKPPCHFPLLEPHTSRVTRYCPFLPLVVSHIISRSCPLLPPPPGSSRRLISYFGFS